MIWATISNGPVIGRASFARLQRSVTHGNAFGALPGHVIFVGLRDIFVGLGDRGLALALAGLMTLLLCLDRQHPPVHVDLGAHPR